MAANAAAVPAMPRRASWHSARAGQNTECATHISVGKPNTMGHRQAVDRQAQPNTIRPGERSAAKHASRPASGAAKNKRP